MQPRNTTHKKPPQKKRILNLLSDNRWHSVIELHEIAWRYGARLYELRQEGYPLTKRRNPLTKLEEWKLEPSENEPEPCEHKLICKATEQCCDCNSILNP